MLTTLLRCCVWSKAVYARRLSRNGGPRWGSILAGLCLAFAMNVSLQAAPPATAEPTPAASESATPPQSKSEAAADTKPPAEQSVEELAARGKKSLVVITHQGRDGKRHGLGSGFIIDSNGLIATNLHVIGESRTITVQLADGRSFEPTAIQAYDRRLDLAILKIEARELPALPLGDSDKLAQGASVVALGHPLGLQQSIVAGVVSGTREIENRSMIQLAMPIEQGNSGGPLLDRQGRVQGIITMKSLVTQNLGFAVAVNQLKPLLEKPNPTPMARWLTIGSLNPAEWQTLFGARWRQRAGHLFVEGLGQGFGGRALCLSQKSVPATPFELAVQVKLTPEDGAAGLVFCSDGQDVHYGFYVSNGRLRLSRFDGPDVFSWQVLQEVASPHYRPGDWNRLRVRFEPGQIQCFVNDQPVIESRDDRLKTGKVGLAKFRTTEADFRQFQVGEKLEVAQEPAGLSDRIADLQGKLNPHTAVTLELTKELLGDGPAAISAIRQRAAALDQQAAKLRASAVLLHAEQVRQELIRLFEKDEADVDLFHAGLLIARLDNDEIDVADYRQEIERMALAVRGVLPADATPEQKLTALNRWMFEEQGFHGSRGEYYHKSNSYLNEVLDDREGLPITLSIVYLELARRLELKMEGVGLPGHFIVRYRPVTGDPQLIDVFEGAKLLSDEEARKMVEQNTSRPFQEADLDAVSKRAMIVRVLGNLLGLARRDQDAAAMLRYVELIVGLDPKRGEERFLRALLYAQSGRKSEALRDANRLLEDRPAGIDLNEVSRFLEVLERGENQ